MPKLQNGVMEYDQTESNKLAKAALMQAFPGVKFTVTASRGSMMYGHTHISWTDGPTEKEAREAIDTFIGEVDDSDHMTDYFGTKSRYTVYQGKKCHFALDPSFRRDYSIAFKWPYAQDLAQKWGVQVEIVPARPHYPEHIKFTPEYDASRSRLDDFSTMLWRIVKDVSAITPTTKTPPPVGPVSADTGKLRLEGAVMGGAWFLSLEQVNLLMLHHDAVQQFSDFGTVPLALAGEYKGHTMLVLSDKFQFGQSKAKLAAANWDILAAYAAGETVTPPTSQPDPAERAAKLAEKLRSLADNMEDDIQQKFNPATANQNVTRHRLDIIEGMRNDGLRMQQTQAALRALAAGWERGDLPTILQSLTSKKAVESALSAARWDMSSQTKIDEPIRTALLSIMPNGVGTEPPQAVKLRDALNDAYTRNIEGFFPTPPAVIEQMINAADIREGMDILEPSAGVGDIVDALHALNRNLDIDLCEVSSRLGDVLTLKGYTLAERDIFDLDAAGQYDRVLMNPPFENGEDLRHVRHCFDLLRPGGVLVAIMAASVQFRTDRKYNEFRDWLDSVPLTYDIEKLPDGAFKTSKRPTGVNTVMVTICKRGETIPAPVPASPKIIPFAAPVPTPASMPEPTPQPAQYTQPVDAADLVPPFAQCGDDSTPETWHAVNILVTHIKQVGYRWGVRLISQLNPTGAIIEHEGTWLTINDNGGEVLVSEINNHGDHREFPTTANMRSLSVDTLFYRLLQTLNREPIDYAHDAQQPDPEPDPVPPTPPTPDPDEDTPPTPATTRPTRAGLLSPEEYDAKRERRYERLLAAAERAETESAANWQQAHDMAEWIPLGQPILVGHHSEKRDRAYRSKIEGKHRKGYDLHQKAQALHERAEAARRNTAIFSDDPRAEEKIEAKIARLEQRQEMMKKANKLVRAGDREGLREMGFSDGAIERLFTPDFLKRVGFPDYELTNNGANIRRLKERLVTLERRATIEATEETIGDVRVVVNTPINRLQLFFPGKPDAATRTDLKAHGYRWTPSEECWQAYITYNAEKYVEKLREANQ